MQALADACANEPTGADASSGSTRMMSGPVSCSWIAEMIDVAADTVVRTANGTFARAQPVGFTCGVQKTEATLEESANSCSHPTTPATRVAHLTALARLRS
jgi:hypothetical protein